MNEKLPFWLALSMHVCGGEVYFNSFQGVSPDVEFKRLTWRSLGPDEKREILSRLKSFTKALESMYESGEP